MGLFQTLNRLGILSVGRRPEWQKQSNTNGAPSSFGDGIPLSGAIRTLIHILPSSNSTCSARIWLLVGGTGEKPDDWVVANGGVIEGIDDRGVIERLSTAGIERIYIEIFDAESDATVSIGPGVME